MKERPQALVKVRSYGDYVKYVEDFLKSRPARNPQEVVVAAKPSEQVEKFYGRLQKWQEKRKFSDEEETNWIIDSHGTLGS